MYVCVSVLIIIMAETILLLLMCITTNIEKNEMLDNSAFTVFAFCISMIAACPKTSISNLLQHLLDKQNP